MNTPRLFSVFITALVAVGATKAGGAAAEVRPITLTSALALAGANNLELAIVREELAEARANHLSAIEQFFPSVEAGGGFRQHDGNSQTTEGRIIDVNKQTYTAAGLLAADIKIGTAIYNELSSRQLVKAAKHHTDAQRNDALYQAAEAFFHLARARSSAAIAAEAVRIANDYRDQLQNAVDAGLAREGEAERAETQARRGQILFEKAKLDQRIAAARLATILNIDPSIELEADIQSLVPIYLIDPKASVGGLVSQALASRPELLRSELQRDAARTKRDAAIYAPIVPALGAETSWGGLGGGDGNSGPANFNNASDYYVGLSWKIGPGGLFDPAAIQSGNARFRKAGHEYANRRNQIVEDVVSAFARTDSLARQLRFAALAVESSRKSLNLADQRREFEIAEILENMDAQRDLTVARLDHAAAIAEHNIAQFSLLRAIGKIPDQATMRAVK
jgi:outer membrane protein TolC